MLNWDKWKKNQGIRWKMRMLSSRRIACFKTLTRVISRKWSNWEENCISWQTFEQFQLSNCSAGSSISPDLFIPPKPIFLLWISPMLHILQGWPAEPSDNRCGRSHLKSFKRAVAQPCTMPDSRIANILTGFQIFGL